MWDYSPALPDEVVAETILWRLPVKSIMQCRCVCKSWYSLITSRYFISSHLLKTLTPKNPQFFLNECYGLDKTGRCLLHFDNNQDHHIRSVLFHLPHPHSHSHSMIKVLGSVKGLICFSIGQGRVSRVVNLVLCNPSIGHFQSIPSPGSSARCWDVKGFGFDERTQDYLILLIISGKAGFIYSLNSNSWRRITRGVPKNWCMRCHSVVFVNGRFHWLVRASRGRGHPEWVNFIMVFDVKREAFDYIPLPKYFSHCPSTLFYFTEYGESSIAVILLTGSAEGSVTHVCMMKEYGKVESWVKLTVGIPRVGFIECSIRDRVLGFINKDQLLIRYYASGFISSQKIKENNNGKLELEEEIKNMMDVDTHPAVSFSVHKYVPSLVLLDRENNIDVAPPTHTKRIKTVHL